MQSETDVLIIGAGPTGLMMACQLLRFGVRFRLLDQRSSRSYDSRAFVLQPRTVEIMQNLGLEDDLLQVAQGEGELAVWFDGEKIIDQRLGHFGIEDTPFPSLYFLSQADTEQIFLEDLEHRGGRVERSKEFLDLTQDDQSVTVRVKHLATSKEEAIRCKYVVGCDGIFSSVRVDLGVDSERSSVEQEFLVADVPITNEAPEPGGLSLHLGSEGVFLQARISRSLKRLMGVRWHGTKVSDRRESVGQELLELGRVVTRLPLEIPDPVWATRYHLHLRFVSRYQEGRVFLAGDAAHVHSPLSGQGMNSGLQDAANLAWKLGFVLRKKAPLALLETYHSERHAVGKELFHNTEKITDGLRGAGSWLGLKPQEMCLPAAGLRFLSQLSTCYERNTFVREDLRGADDKFKAGPEAGSRAPDAPAGNHQLFELMRGKLAHVLIFGSSKEQLKRRAPEFRKIELYSPEMIRVLEFARTPENQILFDRYGVTDSAVVFIRPDGHIGFRSFGDDLYSLTNYFLDLLPDPFVEVSFLQQKK